MATLTVTIASSLGTAARTLTFSGADASRILTAFQNNAKNPAMTQADLADVFAQQLRATIENAVTRAERVVSPDPVVPVMT